MTQSQAAGLFSALGANPYPVFAQLRRFSPVVRIGDSNFWAVSRYEDVVRVLRDPETFSSVVGERQLRGEADTQPSMLFSDPPIHTRLRNLIARAFTPRMVELQRPRIEARAAELVAALLADPEPDLVAGLAYPLPVAVIAGMLGVQDGDMATFKRWSDDIIENLGPVLFNGDDSALADTNREFEEYFSTKVEALRRESDESLLSALVHAETEEGALSHEELMMFARLLLVAGNETTTGLIVNAARAFAEFPEALAEVRRAPDLLPGALEEVLRYYAPFPATVRRTLRDVEVAGTVIPAGQRVAVLLASANRDESVFERPDDFVIDREPNRHVSFGMGIHYCVGAPLARLEAQAAVGALIEGITAIEVPAGQEGGLMRPGGPKSLKVRFTRA